MNFRRYNFFCGVASIFGERGSFEDGVAQARRMAELRAGKTGLSQSDALTLYFRERRLGQLSYTAFTAAMMCFVLWLVRHQEVAEWVAMGLALVPALTYLWACRLAKRMAPDFSA